MRYIDELADGARAQLLALREAAMRGDAAAQAHLTILGGSYWGADPADLFDALAVGIGRWCRGEDAARRTAALLALFGEVEVPEVVRLCGEVVEELEGQAACRLSRIMARIAHGRTRPADTQWLVEQAERMTDELVLYAHPFEDADDAREFSRKVVRGRKPWICHWTRRPIAVGERHLAITEAYDGAVTTTRHSLLSVFLDMEGQDPALAAHLAPVEIRRAA